MRCPRLYERTRQKLHWGRAYQPTSRPVLPIGWEFKAKPDCGVCVISSASNRPSFTRVCFQSLRANFMGSMPAAFHQARSSPARCAAR